MRISGMSERTFALWKAAATFLFAVGLFAALIVIIAVVNGEDISLQAATGQATTATPTSGPAGATTTIIKVDREFLDTYNDWRTLNDEYKRIYYATGWVEIRTSMSDLQAMAQTKINTLRDWAVTHKVPANWVYNPVTKEFEEPMPLPPQAAAPARPAATK